MAFVVQKLSKPCVANMINQKFVTLRSARFYWQLWFSGFSCCSHVFAESTNFLSMDTVCLLLLLTRVVINYFQLFPFTYRS